MILLALIAFFATWGEGMQMISSRISLVYPVLVALYIVMYYTSFQKEHKSKQIVPREFKALFLYILIHTIIFSILNIDSLGFGSERGFENDEGYAYGDDSKGNIIIRYFLFLLFSLYLTVTLRDVKKMRTFAFFYALGFSFTLFLGAFHAYDNAMIRISGGLRDPNAMAFDAIVSLILTIYLLKEHCNTRITRLLAVVSIIIDVSAIFLSFSRGAFLALAIWLFLYIILLGILKNIGKIIIAISVFVLTGYVLVRSMNIDTELIEARFSVEEMRESKGANRGYIWKAYLSKWDTYFVTGMGMANSPKVMRDNKEGVAETYETHNMYILYFVEYGFLGIMLYLLYWLGYIRQYRRTSGNDILLMSLGVLFMIVSFFLNIDKGRTFWIVLAIVNMVWMKNIRTSYNGRYGKEKNASLRIVE
jgi:hypothetical protein